jgi:hypothetical protein
MKYIWIEHMKDGEYYKMRHLAVRMLYKILLEWPNEGVSLTIEINFSKHEVYETDSIRSNTKIYAKL